MMLSKTLHDASISWLTINWTAVERNVHIFVTSAPSCINFGTPEKPERISPSWAGHFHYVVSG
jgi:hypothetical protein